MLLTNLWIFFFTILSYLEALFGSSLYENYKVSYFFDHGSNYIKKGRLVHFFDFTFDFLGTAPIVFAANCLLIYSLSFPMLALAYLTWIDRVYKKNIRIDHSSLGESLIFSWFIDDTPDSKLKVLSFYEPLLILLISIALFIFLMWIPAIFFFLASISMFIQGQQKRLAFRKLRDINSANVSKGQTLVNKENAANNDSLARNGNAGGAGVL